jgi:hypothetical protein
VQREGAEDFVANVPDERFFAAHVVEGDRILARWNTGGVHTLIYHGTEDVSRLYGQDFRAKPD